MVKIVRTSTIGLSLNILLKGQLRFLSKHFEVLGVSSEDRDLEEVRNREKIRVYGIEMERKISPLRDLVALFKLYLFLKKEKPVIVHSITPKAGLLTMLAGKMAGVPIRIHTFTGLIFPSKVGFLQKLLIKMDKLLCWAATNIYPEGNGVKSDLISYKITPKPLKVIANGNVNGIDLTYFSKDEVFNGNQAEMKGALGISLNDFVFVFVGRLVGDKGINELVAAFKELETRNQKLEIRNQKLEIRNQKLENRDREVGVSPVSSPQSPVSSSQSLVPNPKSPTPNSESLVLSKVPKLLLVGPLESELDPLKPETLKEVETNPNIISVGFQKDVRPFFAISDALVFPSYREGFPNVVMQAGAMELPSIVSDINGCNEIIIEGENGTIIPVKNTVAIRQAMQKMMEDPIYYKKLKANARPMIQSRYEQQVVWKALLDEYNGLIKKLEIRN